MPSPHQVEAVTSSSGPSAPAPPAPPPPPPKREPKMGAWAAERAAAAASASAASPPQPNANASASPTTTAATDAGLDGIPQHSAFGGVVDAVAAARPAPPRPGKYVGDYDGTRHLRREVLSSKAREEALRKAPCYAPGTRILLSDPLDPTQLSVLFCHIREQIEVFPASSEDVMARNKKGGIKHPITEGRVGLRCKWCANLPHNDRANGAVSYPNSVRLVHQAIRNWQRHHLPSCKSIPPHVMDKIEKQGRNRKHSGNDSLRYWMESCCRRGMYDCTVVEGGGIRLKGYDYTEVDKRLRAIEERNRIRPPKKKKVKKKAPAAAAGAGAAVPGALAGAPNAAGMGGGQRPQQQQGPPPAEAAEVAQALLSLGGGGEGGGGSPSALLGGNKRKLGH